MDSVGDSGLVLVFFLRNYARSLFGESARWKVEIVIFRENRLKMDREEQSLLNEDSMWIPVIGFLFFVFIVSFVIIDY